jgi:outer membrane protein insertion porin family
MLMKRISGIILFSFLPLLVFSQEVITKIEIEGNKIVSDATIISNIKVKAGQVYNENVINQDLKSLIGLGFFENVEVEKLKTLDGVIVRFNVKEFPILKKIIIRGAKRIRRKKVEETMGLNLGGFLDEYKVKEAIEKVEDLYRRKGFTQATVSYQVDVNTENEAQLEVIIQERSLIRVRKIIIKGNQAFSDRKIKKLMKTREAGFFRRGIFKEETLQDDIKRIRDFYIEQGFADVKVDFTTDYIDEGVYVTVKIDEGIRYYLGKISIEGNKEVEREEIESLIELKEGQIFTKNKVEAQALSIQGLYFDKGYIFSQVKPLSYFNPQTQRVDVTFEIVENEINYVEMILIRGNQKTKDKVIRRELRIYPGDKFEGAKVRKSRQRLENLGFFEEIRFDTEPGSKPNWQNLIIEVKEAKTGYLSFAGGYSSINEFVGFIELRQRNFDYKNFKTFTGAGQNLNLYGSFGTITESYEIEFTNPYVWDTPYTFGFDGYKREHEREEDVGYAYHTDARGGALRLGREFGDYLKGNLAYRFERVEIDDVVETATQELKDEVGTNDLSSLEASLGWDTRDNIFNPQEGFYFLNSLKVTGGFLGGDKDFLKFFSRLSLYFPLVKKSVLEFKIRVGLGDAFSDTEKIPIYERFFAGGSGTIRGYHERKVGPIDEVTKDPIGGEALFVSNLEYTYSLIDFLKVAVFFDTGNVWKEKGDFLSGGFKSSIGAGIRVKTPLGPISLDYGWPLNVEPGEEGKEGKFHFSISRGF